MSAQQEAFRDGQGFILFSTHRERVEEQDRGNGDQSSQVLIYFFMSGRDLFDFIWLRISDNTTDATSFRAFK